MRIDLITDNPELKVLCEQTLEELTSEQVELRLSAPPARPEGHACIWEFRPACFPTRLTSDHVRMSLFVMEVGQVPQFRMHLGTLRASIVFKPVLGPGLRPFLEHSIRVGQAHGEYQHQDLEAAAKSQEVANLVESLLRANL